MSRARPARITPMMRQYLDAKASAPDALLLFRMGDFYEMFYEDAEQASRILDLTLTSRDRDKGDLAIPMAGFPHHASATYVSRLIEAGLKVAICDQVEDPKQAKGLVRREVTRVVTTGTTLEEESLDARRSNYLAAASCAAAEEAYGLCLLEVSTGECTVMETSEFLDLLETVDRAEASELLILQPFPTELMKKLEQLDPKRRVERPEVELLNQLPDPFFAARWSEAGPRDGQAAYAARTAMAYVYEMFRGQAEQIGPVHQLRTAEHLAIDTATRHHLDLLCNNVDGKRRGSLLAAVDETVTAMGARRLARWLGAPSFQLEVIEARHETVQVLVQAAVTRDTLREHLREVPDLERLAARVAAGRASPRDLGAIRDALRKIPEIVAALGSEEVLAHRGAQLDPLPQLHLLLQRALVDEPPPTDREGRFIRRSHDAEIDRLSGIAGGAKETLAEIERRERERTGIPSLKVRFNRVFGYFIEVTRTHLAKVPDDYIRKQTIANGERFITEELKQLEEEILTADERRLDREREIFVGLCQEVVRSASRLRTTAGLLAELDALAGFAESAVLWSYVRPRFHQDEDGALEIEEGRHPVVEQFARELGEPFVPNNVRLDGLSRQILILTGPNMAGKSTVMRQVALIQILAQCGSFVPAMSARLPLCDRLFTRVGASDDVSRGRSTFMVEMTETARILLGATRSSLVLLDEIGRGTSTYDGLAIAWAVTEYLHDQIGAKTIFATHYHELTELSRLLTRVSNVHVAVKEWNDQVIFLRRLLDGAAERSYGIQVARLANLPDLVIGRAKEVLANLEQSDLAAGPVPKAGRRRNEQEQTVSQLSLFASGKQDPVRERLVRLNVDQTTPLQALELLAELKGLLQPR